MSNTLMNMAKYHKESKTEQVQTNTWRPIANPTHYKSKGSGTLYGLI